MEKSRKTNWTKDEEYTLIEGVEFAGASLRGSGNSADINKKKKSLWLDILRKVNSIHGNNRGVEEIRKKWNNLKLTSKSKFDASKREVNKTGGGTNSAGVLEEDDALILDADKSISNTERISDMFKDTPAFSGISGTVDLFQVPSDGVSPVFCEEIPPAVHEVEVKTSYVAKGRSRKRKRENSPIDSQHDKLKDSAADLIPLQRDVLFQQMAVFSEQLKLIEEMRAYYKLKREKLINH